MLPHEGNASTCLAILAGPGMMEHYYSETGRLYVEFRIRPGVETREVTGGLNVDLDLSTLENGPPTGKGG
jgi:hypothetical protein